MLSAAQRQAKLVKKAKARKQRQAAPSVTLTEKGKEYFGNWRSPSWVRLCKYARKPFRFDVMAIHALAKRQTPGYSDLRPLHAQLRTVRAYITTRLGL